MTDPGNHLQPTRLVRHFCGRAALLCVLLIATPALGDKADEYEQQIEELKSNIRALQQELKATQGNRDELREKLEASESEISDLLKNIQKIEKELKKQEKDLQSLREEQNQLRVARKEQQAQIASQVRSAYQLGRQSQIRLLLNQESPERVTRILRYYDYLLAARNQKIQAYLATLNRLDELEPRIAAETRALEENRRALNERHKTLRKRQRERRQTIAALNERIANTGAELTQMQDNRARLEQLLGEVRAVTDIPLRDNDRPFKRLKGQLPWPTKGVVQHGYGSPQFAEKMQWNGLLIKAAAGQPVFAVHHGRVVFADYFRGHGLLLIIDHGEGYMTLYAHNQNLLKETGEWVSAGETIASVGNTGGRKGAGLYFEIRQDGKPTDPANWLAQA